MDYDDHEHNLESDQQSHFGSWFAFCYFNLQIGAKMRGTFIPHLKPILNKAKLKIEMHMEMKCFIFLSAQQLRQIATLKWKLR